MCATANLEIVPVSTLPFVHVVVLVKDGAGQFRLLPVSTLYSFSRLDETEHAHLSLEDQLLVSEFFADSLCDA